ncbi:NAD-dependent deacylase [Saprospiraceae bacterium]|nr:NAD-dependent deacylase [Saprospiraceae bacterium]
MRKKIVVLSGAGVSAESGINTFRDADGLWEGHDVMEVASPEGWNKNRKLVNEFYNERRKQLNEVSPNKAHKLIASLQDDFDVYVVTQNVDDLHERAGSKEVLHLHGELRKVRSTGDPELVYPWVKDVTDADKCEKGHALRPHIVWFGEAVPALSQAVDIIHDANIVLIIGTSLQVYPAAGLIGYAAKDAQVYYIDPKPFISFELERREHTIIEEKATIGMEILISHLKN